MLNWPLTQMVCGSSSVNINHLIIFISFDHSHRQNFYSSFLCLLSLSSSLSSCCRLSPYDHHDHDHHIQNNQVHNLHHNGHLGRGNVSGAPISILDSAESEYSTADKLHRGHQWHRLAVRLAPVYSGSRTRTNQIRFDNLVSLLKMLSK